MQSLKKPVNFNRDKYQGLLFLYAIRNYPPLPHLNLNQWNPKLLQITSFLKARRAVHAQTYITLTLT